jgi:hypothetical protein
MALGKLFKSFLGGGTPASPSVTPVDYKGFSIEAAPIDEDGKFRTAGYISGEIDGEVRRVRFIRADQSSSMQSAVEHSFTKGRQIIDEQGARLLQKDHL